MEKIKRINRELVHEGNVIDLYEDTMLLPNGKTEKWDLVHHRMGAACVLPVLPDGRIVMVHQQRPAIERLTLEVPAGKRDSLDEDTIVCAKRELEEETGYSSDDISLLCKLRTTVAFCDEFIDVYVAKNIFSIGEQHLDESEEIDVEAFELDELIRRVYAGEIQDSKTVSAIMCYAYQVNGQEDTQEKMAEYW